MKTMVLTLAVAAGLLAQPFAALAENTLAENVAALNGLDSMTYPPRADTSGLAMMDEIAIPANAWAGNYMAGLVHEPAGN